MRFIKEVVVPSMLVFASGLWISHSIGQIYDSSIRQQLERNIPVLNSWKSYSDSNCVMDSRIYGVRIKSGKSVYKENMISYSCEEGSIHYIIPESTVDKAESCLNGKKEDCDLDIDDIPQVRP